LILVVTPAAETATTPGVGAAAACLVAGALDTVTAVGAAVLRPGEQPVAADTTAATTTTPRIRG
jgi:hypothetical protein